MIALNAVASPFYLFTHSAALIWSIAGLLVVAGVVVIVLLRRRPRG